MIQENCHDLRIIWEVIGTNACPIDASHQLPQGLDWLLNGKQERKMESLYHSMQPSVLYKQQTPPFPRPPLDRHHGQRLS